MELKEIYQPIEIYLSEVKEEIKKQLLVEDNFMKQVIEDIIASSGKFLRPALALFAFSTGNNNHKNKDDIIKIASGIELIHTATLIHDDVIDETVFRRNNTSLYVKWGNNVSVLFGDYLFSRSYTLLTHMNYPEIVKALSGTINSICDGELKQIGKSYAWDLSEEEYLTIVRQKCASLFSFSCFCGAHVGGAALHMMNALVNYGLNFGIAFQVIDDCLDFVGDEKLTGKSLTSDLRKGKITLPLICLRNSIPEDEWRKVIRFILSGTSNETICLIKGMFQKYQTIPCCVKTIMHHMGRAKEEAKGVEDMSIRRSLINMCDYTLAKLERHSCFYSQHAVHKA